MLCFAFVCNDSSLTACALAPFRDVLHFKEGAPDGWGMGYYQGGQPLLRKQPRTPPGPLDFVATAANLRTNIILGHLRTATVGGHQTENTHPFRHRNWIFCHSGTVDGFDGVKEDLLRSVPDFLRRNIRGKTDSEHLFHLFLSFLNDTGRMDDPRIEPAIVGRALSSTFAYVDRMVAERGGSKTEGCCIVSNGYVVVGMRSGTAMKISRQTAYTCQGPDDRAVAMKNLRGALLVGGQAPDLPGWEEIPDGSTLSIDGDLNIETTSPH